MSTELDDLAYDHEYDDSVPCWNCGGEGETDCNPIECCDAHPCHICNGRGWLR